MSGLPGRVGRRRRGSLRIGVLAAVVGCALLAAACSSAAGTASQPAPTAPVGAPTTTTTTLPPTTTTEDPGWSSVSATAAGFAVDERTVVASDGTPIVVVRFRAGRTRFDLHVGSADPPTGGVSLSADAGPAIAGDEAPQVLAAFNGGFLASAHVGGFEVDGRTLVPLSAGEASFVIDANGAGHVGVWGQDLPFPGEQVASVRQNLPPLVVGGQPSPQIGVIGAWGATLGGGADVARSALGEDARANILYAASMSTVPADLAQALIACGVRTAMELDINPEWVQLALARTPGAPLSTGVPNQNRPADQFSVGWTRDFVVVLPAL